jgi:hypothetical protein
MTRHTADSEAELEGPELLLRTLQFFSAFKFMHMSSDCMWCHSFAIKSVSYPDVNFEFSTHTNDFYKRAMMP